MRQGADHRIAQMAGLIHLADRIDVMLNHQPGISPDHEQIRTQVRDLSGTYFSPEAIHAFLQQSRTEAFWLALESRHLENALNGFFHVEPVYIGLDDVAILAGILARIVDDKSSYTGGHSLGVGRLCRLIGERMNQPPLTLRKLEIAGLLHDLGKLAIPDEIVDKAAYLSAQEFQVVKRHPFETYAALLAVPGLEDVADWAACHHERADGTGYPFGRTTHSLTLPHTIVALSEIIQALFQDRPHRTCLPEDHALDILDHLAHHETIFEPLLAVVRNDFEYVARVAHGVESVS